MELRRLEALQNLSGGTSKVIFDLAKPFGDVQGAAVAAAMAAGNVRVESRPLELPEEIEEPATAPRSAKP